MPPTPLACFCVDVVSKFLCCNLCWIAGGRMQLRCHVFYNCSDFVSGWCQFGYPCHLACLLRPLWHPGGPLSDPGELGTTRGEMLGSTLGLLSISDGFRDQILKVLCLFWNRICVFCHACLQVTFCNDFGVWIWMSGLPESSICCRGVAEDNFSHLLGFCCFRCHFYFFQKLCEQF